MSFGIVHRTKCEGEMRVNRGPTVVATERKVEAASLDAELATYAEHRADLLESSEGAYVLIRGTDVLGLFDSEAEAIEHGYILLGNVPFLVKCVEQTEHVDLYMSGHLSSA